MPYSITTKDGITINNIPDDVPPDSQALKDRVAAIRSGAAPPEVPAGQEPETTAAGVAGAINRGLAPYAASSVAGPAGPAVVGAAKLIGDPITQALNSLLGALGVPPEHQQISPSQALELAMDKLGIYKPRTATERVVQAGAEAAGGGLGGASLGRAMMKAEAPLVAGAGKVLAAQPAQQIAGGASAGMASQTAAELGGGPGTQFGAGLLGGMVGARAAQPRTPIQRAYQLPDLAEVVDDIRPGAAGPGVAPEELGRLIKDSAKGSSRSRQKLADISAVNIQAKEAAERLGIELPADVFSDSPQIRAAAGLTRSVVGSEPEATWRTIVTNAVDKADEVVRQMDATFTEGQVSPGVVSQKVRDRLVKTRSEMNDAARQVYDSVDQSVPKNTPVKMDKVESALLGILDEVGEGGLSAQEKKLMKMVDGSEPITYGRLIREKNLMGQALAGKESPYGNMEAASLKRLYAALAEDQLDNVGRIGGEELRSELRGANLLYAKERALGKRIVAAFGEDSDGSIANRMRAAITGSSKGGSEDFAKLMKVVPDDLKKETVATALASVTRSARGAERGGFGFSEFAKVYQGLRANAPVYKQVVDILGPDSHKIMRDLYEVSRRVTDARANVLTTGKANQALMGSLRAEGLVQKVMDSTVARGAATSVAAGVGGPIAAGVASQGLNALANGKKDIVAAAGNLFNSDEFKRLAVEAATKPRVNPATVEKLSRSARFKAFGKKIGITDPEQSRVWILSAIYGDEATQEENQ